jgi:hypothetical protein
MTRLLTFFAITAMVILTAAIASAESASVTITGGSLVSTPADVSLSGVTLDGTDKTATSTADNWDIADNRGTGAGYCVTIDSTDFSDGSHTLDISQTDQEFKIQILDGDTVCNAGDSTNMPASQVSTQTAITTNPTTLNILSTPTDEGMGNYTYYPDLEQEVPAYSYAGSYTATITITANSGPCS